MSPMTRIALLALVPAVLFIGVVWTMHWALEHRRLSADPLPVLANVPEFTRTERSGRTIGRADLLGKVWVASFVFTRCGGPCPTLSAKMAELQHSFRRAGSHIQLVSFSVDPERDTPAVLQQYAANFEADPERWWMLTGSKDGLVQLVMDGFKLPLGVPETADATHAIIHSDRLVVVDRKGRIRSYRHGTDAEATALVRADVERLLREP